MAASSVAGMPSIARSLRPRPPRFSQSGEVHPDSAGRAPAATLAPL